MWCEDIAHKWVPARLTGPKVTEKQVLDFIWKTDGALQSPAWAGNDRVFSKELREFLKYPDEDAAGSLSEVFRAEADLRATYGVLDLEHLSSNWVCTSYIGGPYGPVHPNGRVQLATNFGKWPDVDEIEKDLTVLAGAFDWLEFQLALWDYPNEDESVDDNPPTHAWELKGGSFKRIPTDDVRESITGMYVTDPVNHFMTMLAHGASRERTWTMNEIRTQWGDRIV